MFIAVGLFFLIGARNYELGSAARMGPAYFPTMVGGLLAVIGVVVFFQSLVVEGGKVAAFPLRLILFMTVALLLFGYLLKPLGLVAALTLWWSFRPLPGMSSSCGRCWSWPSR